MAYVIAVPEFKVLATMRVRTGPQRRADPGRATAALS